MKHIITIADKIRENGHQIVVSKKEKEVRLYLGNDKKQVILSVDSELTTEQKEALHYYLVTNLNPAKES